MTATAPDPDDSDHRTDRRLRTTAPGQTLPAPALQVIDSETQDGEARFIDVVLDQALDALAPARAFYLILIVPTVIALGLGALLINVDASRSATMVICALVAFAQAFIGLLASLLHYVPKSMLAHRALIKRRAIAYASLQTKPHAVDRNRSLLEATAHVAFGGTGRRAMLMILVIAICLGVVSIICAPVIGLPPTELHRLVTAPETMTGWRIVVATSWCGALIGGIACAMDALLMATAGRLSPGRRLPAPHSSPQD